MVDPTTEATRSMMTQVNKLNLYMIPQYLWLVFLYYLMLNVFLNYAENLSPELSFVPDLILEKNNDLKAAISSLIPFIWFMGISLIGCGFLISAIRLLPYLEKFKMSYDGEYGLFLGTWLLLIGFTHALYAFIPGIFPFLILILAITKDGILKLKEKRKFSI
jgi:hypothetical protein